MKKVTRPYEDTPDSVITPVSTYSGNQKTNRDSSIFFNTNAKKRQNIKDNKWLI